MSFKAAVPGVPRYINDGKGRDTYISFYNGGFSNYPYSKSYKKDFYETNQKRYHPDLYMRRPIIKYNMDGSGRDFFIHQNILWEHCKLKDFSDFSNILRNGIELNPVRINKSLGRTKFEKKLINRIFYGKCSGVKDRLMEPKVHFNKKGKNKILKLNLTSPNFIKDESPEFNKIKKNNNDNNNLFRYNINHIDNNIKSKEKFSLSTNKKKKFLNRNYTNDIIDEKNFVKKINSLYLFNHKKNIPKVLDLPILI